MSACHHNCYTDSATGNLYCPAFGGWQIGGCPMEREDLEDDENEKDDGKENNE